MANGVPVERQYFLVATDGSVIIDWGNGRLQDVLTGEFRTLPEESLHRPVQDHELNRLIAAGRVESFDHRQVYVLSMPEDLGRSIK